MHSADDRPARVAGAPALPAGEADGGRGRAREQAHAVGDGLDERPAGAAEVDADRRVVDVAGEHERAQADALEQRGQPEVRAERDERAEQDRALALRRERERRDEEHRERDEPEAVEQPEDARALGERAGARGRDERPGRRGDEHPVGERQARQAPEPVAARVAAGDVAHHDREQSGRDEQPVRPDREADVRVVARQHGGCDPGRQEPGRLGLRRDVRAGDGRREQCGREEPAVAPGAEPDRADRRRRGNRGGDARERCPCQARGHSCGISRRQRRAATAVASATPSARPAATATVRIRRSFCPESLAAASAWLSTRTGIPDVVFCACCR